MAFYYSRRKLKVHEDAEGGELNVVPYLDILMNLIIFMLLSMTGLATFGILNVTAPNAAASGVAASETPQEQVLSVGISARGFYVAGAGAVLGDMTGTQAPAPAPVDVAVAPPTIPLLANGQYDFAALTALMAKIKADPAFASQTKVLVGAEAAVQYDTLIKTMDAIRETSEKQLLFSDVSLNAM